MNAVTPVKDAQPLDPLALLRQPFPPNQISKLPKPTKAQTDAVKQDFKKGIRCKECGAWHHPDVVHLDYVGHAALTDRLLDVDPQWFWEPVSFGPDGLPAFDRSGGLWIKLTVCGVTRLGYGNADPKPNQDAGAREKEVIGDALRNAAMRFGAALDLWHKGDLHAHTTEEPADEVPQRPEPKRISTAPPTLAERADRFAATLKAVKTPEELKRAYELGGKLFDDLEKQDPERRVELAMLYEARRDELVDGVVS